jgi:primosomal protein N' (replication factor Y)
LTQVAGRAGRREVPGEVIVQTYDPEHYSVRAAAEHDYETFYDSEIDSRRELGYPPFRRLAHVVASSPNEERAERGIAEFKQACGSALEEGGLDVEMVGPAPAPLARLKGRYRWHLLLRSPEHEPLRQAVAATRERFREPREVTLTIDMDPVSLL